MRQASVVLSLLAIAIVCCGHEPDRSSRRASDRGMEWPRWTPIDSSSPDGVNLTSVFLDGVNTITVSNVPGFQMRVSGGGWTVRTGGIVIDLEKAKPKIVVRADGTASVS